VLSKATNIYSKIPFAPYRSEAKTVSKYARKAGLGMRKKAPRRRIKGGALKRGGSLGRAGSGLVRAGMKRPIRRRAYARRRGAGMKGKVKNSFP